MPRNAILLALSILTLVASLSYSAYSKSVVPRIAPAHGWRDLEYPHPISPQSGAIYYSFPIENGSRAHLIVVDMRSGKWRLRPALAEKTKATSTLANELKASAAVNGGYFNLSDGVSASYVYINGKQVADPTINRALIENPKLSSYLNHIYRRSEIRILKDLQGKTLVKIAAHDEPLPAGTTLTDSLQAGPRLLPELTAEKEAFIRRGADGKEEDSIGCRREAARTAFGITADGYVMLLSVCGKGQNPESSGIDLNRLSSLMKELGCVDAINLDGGASTTMYVRLATRGTETGQELVPGTIVCGRNPETLVKSVLLLESSSGNQR